MDRLDEEKLEMLRTWGEGLMSDGRDELRAAGRAVLMLVEEIERLHVDLWHARQETASEVPASPVRTDRLPRPPSIPRTSCRGISRGRSRGRTR